MDPTDELVNKIINVAEHGDPQLDDHSRVAISLAMKYNREGLERLLGEAIDRGDDERMHLLLDAIEADHQSRQMLESIAEKRPSAERLLEYARSLGYQGD